MNYSFHGISGKAVVPWVKLELVVFGLQSNNATDLLYKWIFEFQKHGDTAKRFQHLHTTSLMVHALLIRLASTENCKFLLTDEAFIICDWTF